MITPSWGADASDVSIRPSSKVPGVGNPQGVGATSTSDDKRDLGDLLGSKLGLDELADPEPDSENVANSE